MCLLLNRSLLRVLCAPTVCQAEHLLRARLSTSREQGTGGLTEGSVWQGRRQALQGLTTLGQVQPWEDSLHSVGVGGRGPLGSEREDEVREGLPQEQACEGRADADGRRTILGQRA